VDPALFRRDPWLRTSGYHLATWSLVAFVLELRRAAATDGGDAAFLVVLLGGALLTSLTHERRVGKMAGIAGAPLHPRIDVLWWSVIGAIVLGGLALHWIARPHWMFPMWMMLAGEGFLLWGMAVGFAWYRALGVAMIAAGLLDIAMMATGAGRWPRLVVLGALLPAAGLVTSRRYLWFRAPRF
jgi:hypothetical protein